MLKIVVNNVTKNVLNRLPLIAIADVKVRKTGCSATVQQTSGCAHLIPPPPIENPKISFKNNIKLCSFDASGPVSRLAISFLAGSRYERYEYEGVTHFIRRCAGLKSKQGTEFMLNRCLQQYGGNLYCIADRELITFIVVILRNNVERGFMYLEQTCVNPLYRPWEVKDQQKFVKEDVYRMSDEILLYDKLHKTAYTTGLGNSLYCAKHHLSGYFNSDWLHCYHRTYFQPTRAAVVGHNVPHCVLEQFADRVQFGACEEVKTVQSEFQAGEIRYPTKSLYANVIVARQGASISDTKKALSFSILKEIWGSGSTFANPVQPVGQLVRIARKLIKCPVLINSFNFCYSDSGLYGFQVTTDPGNIEKVLRNLLEGLNALDLNEAVLERAKNVLITKTLYCMGSEKNMIEEMAGQMVYFGQFVGCECLLNELSQIKLSDVEPINKKFLGKGMVMTSVGNIGNIPFLDKLIS